MNWLVKWGVKKYVVNIVNTALKENEHSVAKARGTVVKYIGKAGALLSFLKSLDDSLADNRLTEDEVDDVMVQAEKLARDLTA